jgi:hypothetical protein
VSLYGDIMDHAGQADLITSLITTAFPSESVMAL